MCVLHDGRLDLIYVVVVSQSALICHFNVVLSDDFFVFFPTVVLLNCGFLFC